MKIIDNVNKTVKEDLTEELQKGSRLSIAAACFSIYAYQELKKQLEGIDELRFIFTSPTFITEKTPKAQREFYIPRISRERSLYGTEFEVKLRNERAAKSGDTAALKNILSQVLSTDEGKRLAEKLKKAME